MSENAFLQSTIRCLSSATPEELRVRDIRSIAYIMVEMITGHRVRGSAMDDMQLLGHFSVNTLEKSFVMEVLNPSSTTQSLATHPYLETSVVLTY